MLEFLFQNLLLRNAFLAGTMIAIVTAVTGYFTVIRAQSFAAHALSHVGFAGATGAALLGINGLLGMFVFTLLAAFGIGRLGERIKGRDIEIGMLLSFLLGCGVLFMNLYTQNATSTVNLLFGSILSVSNDSVWITVICGLIVLLLLSVLYRPLLFSSIDPEVAAARGLPVRFLGLAFILLLALTVSIAVQVVGILLVFALLVAPAATAERLVSRPGAAILLSLVLGLLYTWSGLWLSVVTPLPISFCIAILAALPYFVAVGLSRLRRPRRYQPEPHVCCGSATEPTAV